MVAPWRVELDEPRILRQSNKVLKCLSVQGNRGPVNVWSDLGLCRFLRCRRMERGYGILWLLRFGLLGNICLLGCCCFLRFKRLFLDAVLGRFRLGGSRLLGAIDRRVVGGCIVA